MTAERSYEEDDEERAGVARLEPDDGPVEGDGLILRPQIRPDDRQIEGGDDKVRIDGQR